MKDEEAKYRDMVIKNIESKKKPKSFWASFIVAVFVLLGVTGFYIAKAATTTYSLFSSSDVPAILAANSRSGTELGMKFSAKYAGTVTGVSFYKSAENTGTHIGSLWDTSGDLLASVKFTNETASGWQTAMFTQPVKIAANVSYVIAYYAPRGHFSETNNYFSSAAVTNGPLTGLKSAPIYSHRSYIGHLQNGNGVYSYGWRPSYPFFSGNGTNYWVDVLYNTSALSPTVAPAPPATVTATQSGTSIDLTWTAGQSSNPISSYQIYRNGSLLTSVSGTTLTYTDSSGLTSGTTYSYQIKTEDNTNTVSTASPTATVTYNVTTTPAPTVKLSASPTTVTVGQASTLTWSSTNATSCTASDGWTGTKATSGTFATGDLSATTTYDISCTGTSGTAATASAIVTANPPSTGSTGPGTGSGGSSTAMAAPSGFTASQMTMDDQFGNASSYSLLKNWNFGVTSNNTFSPESACTDSYATWYQSGTSPYLGASSGTQYDADYDLPQQVSQTTGGGTYNDFSSTGSGLTITAKYAPGSAGGDNYTWASGSINSFAKAQIGGNGENYFVQVKAQLPYAIVNGSRVDNGAWAGIWLLPGCGNTTATDYESDMEESGYSNTANPLQEIVTTLHNGGSSGTQQTIYENSTDLSAGYNIYGLDINSATGTETYYINGQEYAQYDDGPTGAMFLILNLQIANSNTNGWHAQIVSNSVTEQLNVAEVQMYAQQ